MGFQTGPQMSDIDEIVENEWYIVRNSGEIPEIAYNSSVYYLTRSPSGPQLVLSKEWLEKLRDAAVVRYLEIILRDLDHTNVGASIYRGIARSICNYNRFCAFCTRLQLDPEAVGESAAKALALFLQQEHSQLKDSESSSTLNCNFRDLKDYAEALGVEFHSCYFSLQKTCHGPD